MKAGLALTLAILLAACGSGEDAADSEAKPVALVALAPAQQGAVDETLTVYGAVEAGAMGKHVLAAPAEATVVAIEAPVGTKVGAGQVVVRLAPSPTSRLDYAKAATDAATAQAAYARAQRLRADGLVSDADVETARAAAQSAGATRASLGARNGALTLRAPTAGFVESVASAPGDLVAPGTAVASIAGSGNLRARFGIDPAQASRVRPGMVLRVTPPSGISFSAPVLSVDPVVDPTTKLASLFVNVPAGSGIGTNSALNGQLDLGSTGEHPVWVDAEELTLNDLARVRIALASPLPIDAYNEHRSTGAFIIVDAADGWTLGAGMAGAPAFTVEHRRTPDELDEFADFDTPDENAGQK